MSRTQFNNVFLTKSLYDQIPKMNEYNEIHLNRGISFSLPVYVKILKKIPFFWKQGHILISFEGGCKRDKTGGKNIFLNHKYHEFYIKEKEK